VNAAKGIALNDGRSAPRRMLQNDSIRVFFRDFRQHGSDG
jgi:hypothetical protein